MDTLIGLVAFYAWIHTAFIFMKEPKKRTTYEKAVSALGLVLLVLVIIGLSA